jgi:hypothetical protein
MKPTNYSDLRSMLIINGAISGSAASSGGLTFVTDGTTTVGPVSSILFDGSSVSDLGAHEARVVGTARLFGQFTNKAGRDLADGDVVIIDPGTNAAVTTTPEGRTQTSVGVVYGTIPSNSVGFVQLAGFTNSVRVPFSQTRGYYLETNSMALQAVGNSTRRSGSFGQLLTSGLYPQAWLWGETDQTAGGGSDPLTTKGDIWGFSTVDARIPVGANATVLTADSTQALGVKWAAGGVSPLTTKGDLWGFSTVDARVPVGGNSTFLMASSIDALGVAWGTPSGGGGGSGGIVGTDYVQAKAKDDTTSTNSLGITMDSTPTNGNYLILCSSRDNTGTITSITQTNVTWTVLVAYNANGPSIEIWKGQVSASAGTSITVAYSNVAFSYISVYEFAGISGTLDQSATFHTTAVLGTNQRRFPMLVPAQSSALVIACVACDNMSSAMGEISGGPLIYPYGLSLAATRQGHGVGYIWWGKSPIGGYGKGGSSNNVSSAIISIT